MKKTLAVVAMLAGAVSGYSQGQVNFSDYANSDFQITIWSPQVATPSVQLTGNSPSTFGTGLTSAGPDIPSGTQTGYTGVPLGGSATGATASTDYANGNLWTVQLYGGPQGSTFASGLAPISGAVANMYTTAANAGLFNYASTAAATIPGVAAGGTAALALAAWYNGNGTFTSYGTSPVEGVSTIVNQTIQGGTIAPPDLQGPGGAGVASGGITSFSLAGLPIITTPEPSTIALGIMGASAFLMRLRRK